MDITVKSNIAQGTQPTKGPTANTRADNEKFGDVWNKIQARYGARPKAPRKIKKQLDKDDFLRIMITQMKHQDPTKPFEAEKLASEIAQITSVEQLQNVNTALKRLEGNNRPLERLAMTNMIGKTVTVNGNRFAHDKMQNSMLTFNLPEESVETRLTIVSPKGEVVLDKEIGSYKKGANSFIWDGLQANTLQAENGKYMFQVKAISKDGKPMKISSTSKGRVIGVSYEAGEPVLLVGDAHRHQKIVMDSVVRVEDLSPAALQQQQQQAAARMGNGNVSLPPNLAQRIAEDKAKLETRTGKEVATAPAIRFKRGAGSMNANHIQANQANTHKPGMQLDASGRQIQRNPRMGRIDSTKPAAEQVQKGFPSGLGKMQVKGGERK